MDCKTCNKPLGIYAHHSAHFCSTECRKAERSKRDKVSREEKRNSILIKTCRRCQVQFNAENKSRRLCPTCIELKKTEQSYHQCCNCNKRIKMNKERCYVCQRSKDGKESRIRTEKHRAVVKAAKVLKNSKVITKQEIDPKWLRRGNVSSTSLTSSIMNGD